MRLKFEQSGVGLAVVAAIVVFGCGGGGSTTATNGSVTGGATAGTTAGATTGTVTTPTAKTKSDVAGNLAAYGQSVVSNSFVSYGQKVRQGGTAYYDIPLRLWASVALGPHGLTENLFLDKAETIPAGSLAYKANDIAFTLSGPFSVTSGLYSGLTGVYFLATQSTGFNGSINFGIPNVATTVSQFAEQSDTNGNIFGTATIEVALASGYTQNEQVAFNPDGTLVIKSLDSQSCRTTFNIAADYSGTGQITGTDPGLPATFKWDRTGTGQIVYADGSYDFAINWTYSP